MFKLVYLDAASTAKYKNIDDIIVNTMITAMQDSWQNPSSLYALRIKNKIEICRSNIAEFINAKPYEIYFTSGASESNNWAIRGWVDEMLMDTLQMINVVTTPIEHKSILAAIHNGALGAHIHYCNVNKFGIVDCKSLEQLLIKCKREPTLVSVHMANNEIGIVQPIKMISELVHKYNGVLHVDATQAFGHILVDVEELGIDLMSVSGHKLSPVLKGIGFLYKKNCINIHPLIYGSQENGLRGGTENVFGIIGLNKAVELCDISGQKTQELCDKRDYFIGLLKSKFGCKLNGDDYHRLPNNINVIFPQNITGEALLHMLDLSNIQISTGSACNSRFIEPSHVLKAIGLTDEQAMKTVRLTLSDDITYDDIDFVLDEIDKAIKIIENIKEM